MRRVVVVGAGLAGLTCAKTLQAGGCEVVVLEKSRGVGGRLSTRRSDLTQYDHGAQYFTARDERFIAFINDRLADGSVAVWAPRLDVKLAQTITEPWYVGTPGMSSLGRAQAIGLDVRTEVRVQLMSRREGHWQLAMEDGSTLDGFDAVVVAVPNAQAMPLLAEHAPDWAKMLEQMPMEPCWTVMVSTQASLTEFDAGLPRTGAIGWWARNSSKPGRPESSGRHDWVVQATAAWTQANLDTDKAGVAQALLQAFALELGVESIEPTCPPMAHRWLYSRRKPGVATLAEPCFRTELGLGICGDGLAHSRVEQAYLSGLQLAQAILAQSN